MTRAGFDVGVKLAERCARVRPTKSRPLDRFLRPPLHAARPLPIPSSTRRGATLPDAAHARSDADTRETARRGSRSPPKRSCSCARTGGRGASKNALTTSRPTTAACTYSRTSRSRGCAACERRGGRSRTWRMVSCASTRAAPPARRMAQRRGSPTTLSSGSTSTWATRGPGSRASTATTPRRRPRC